MINGKFLLLCKLIKITLYQSKDEINLMKSTCLIYFCQILSHILFLKISVFKIIKIIKFPIKVILLIHNASFAHMPEDSLLLSFCSILILLSLFCYVRNTQNRSLHII